MDKNSHRDGRTELRAIWRPLATMMFTGLAIWGFALLVVMAVAASAHPVVTLLSGVLGVGAAIYAHWRLSIQPFCDSVEARYRLAAGLDPVTGLPTRARAVERICQDLPADRGLGIINVDLQRFTELNGALGWERGDKVLALVAAHLQEVLEPSEVVSRIGPNAFLIATADRAQAADLEGFAAKISEGLARGIVLGRDRLCLATAIGLSRLPAATAPWSAIAVESVIAESQIALAQAKSEGRSVCFSAQMRRELQRRHQVVCELALAFERDEIEPHFQPQIAAMTGRITGVEALARWQHPQRGLLLPGQFLDVAQRENLLPQLSAAVVRKSAAAFASWRAAGLEIGQIGFNFSARELAEPHFPDRLLFDLDRAGIAPEEVAIEVLESAMIERGDDPVTRNIAALSSRGFRIDLDDFGTGHASLSNLQLFHVNRLKIDRSFVSDLHLKPARLKMTETMIRLADNLGIEALAEGVETDAEWGTLIELGCHGLQGFRIAKPMPAE
ncbi:MAG: bifunctional diguanylate cyclase/phosphodiesterase, partial [Pseudomonadota bacterium]